MILEKKAVKKENAANASRKHRLRPTPQMTAVIRRWMGCYRVVYNKSLALSKATRAPKSYNYFGFIRKAVTTEKNVKETWLQSFPSSLRKKAAKDLCDAFWSNMEKRKKDPEHKFELRFKSKKNDTQCLKVEHAHFIARCSDDNVVSMTMFPRVSEKLILEMCDKKGIQYDPSMLDIGLDPSVRVEKDSTIVMDKLGRFWIHVPYRRQEPAHSPETQGRKVDIVALDPGVRTFLTTYDGYGSSYKLGDQAMSRIARLSHCVDDLVSQIERLKKIDPRWTFKKKRVARRKVKRLCRAVQRMRIRVKNLVSEMHWKVARFLCTKYEHIIIPPFETQNMITKKCRKMNSKTARNMLTLSHYTFRNRLMHVAKFERSEIHVLDEAYTSKTCTNCGWMNEKLGGSKVFVCSRCGIRADRDGAAARNIFLKHTITED